MSTSLPVNEVLAGIEPAVADADCVGSIPPIDTSMLVAVADTVGVVWVASDPAGGKGAFPESDRLSAVTDIGTDLGGDLEK